MASAKTGVVVEEVKQPNREDERKKLRASMQKQYGKDVVNRLGDDPAAGMVVPQKTGLPALDVALGIGGLPKGRLINCWGQEGGGKSLLADIVAAQVQRDGGNVAVIDVEHKWSVGLALLAGLNVDDIEYIRPPSAEAALDICHSLVYDREKKEVRKIYDLIIFDSVAALITEGEMEADQGTSHIAPIARSMAEHCKKMVHALSFSGCIAFYINQLRSKPLTMYGNPYKPTGGKALHFFCTIELEVKNKPIKEGGLVVGMSGEISVKKNQVAPPFREASFEFHYEKGINRIALLVDHAVEVGILERRGGYYFYLPDENFRWQGRDGIESYLDGNPEFYIKLAQDVNERCVNVEESA